MFLLSVNFLVESFERDFAALHKITIWEAGSMCIISFPHSSQEA